MEIAKDKVVPRGTTDSEIVVGLQQVSFHSQLGCNLQLEMCCSEHLILLNDSVTSHVIWLLG